jgi:hypothetical protein
VFILKTSLRRAHDDVIDLALSSDCSPCQRFVQSSSSGPSSLDSSPCHWIFIRFTPPLSSHPTRQLAHTTFGGSSHTIYICVPLHKLTDVAPLPEAQFMFIKVLAYARLPLFPTNLLLQTNAVLEHLFDAHWHLSLQLTGSPLSFVTSVNSFASLRA